MSDPFTNAFSKNVFGSATPEPTTKGLDDLETLRELAQIAGKDEEASHGKMFNAVEKMGRALNYDVANISGALLGLIRDDMTVAQGRRYGVEHNTEYTDVLKELYGQPTSTAGKVAMSATGFAADVIFSPLTYLSLGYGGVVKAGTKAAGTFVTKSGTELFKRAALEFTSHADELVKSGIVPKTAERLAMFQAKQDLNTFTQKAIASAKNGTLNVKDYENLVKRGLSSKTVEQLMSLGGEIIDRGGVKMFGKTLLSSEFIKQTPIGKAAARLGETKIAQALSETFGEMFNFGFKANQMTKNLMVEMGISEKKAADITGTIFKATDSIHLARTRAMKSVFNMFDTAFGGLSPEQGVKFAEGALLKREEEYKLIQSKLDEAVSEYNKLTGSSISGVKEAYKLSSTIDDEAAVTIGKITKETEAITKQIFDERAKKIIAGEELPTKYAAGGPDYTKVDNLTKDIYKLKEKLKELTSAHDATAVKKSADIDEIGLRITPEEALQAGKNLVRYEEERLTEKLDALLTKIDKLSKESIPEVSPFQEAGKYDTFDEFVKAQGEPVYRGARTPELKETSGDLGTGFYFTKDNGLAKIYAKNTGMVHEYVIDPRAKIVDQSKIPYGVNREEWATQNGYDGISYKQGSYADTAEFKDSQNLLIYNKDIIKTRSQLTDIWNKALGKDQFKTTKKLTPDEILVLSQREMKKIQDDLTAKHAALNKIINSREEAYKMMKMNRLEFPDDKRLQALADRFFNGDGKGPTVAQVIARIAGIPEHEAYKFYIRPYYRDMLMVKKAQHGRYLSPLSQPKQDFMKMWTPEAMKLREDLIKDPAELYKRATMDVIDARLKSNALKKIFNTFSKTVEGKTPSEIEKLGFVPYKKKLLGEEISGYIPEAIKNELDNIVVPKKDMIDSIARNLGFDYVTNLFKSWTTSVFPAFQWLNMTSNQVQLMMKLGVDWFNPNVQKNTYQLAMYMGFPKNGIMRRAFGMDDAAEKAFMAQKFTTKNGEVWTNKKLINEISKQTDIFSTGFFGDIEQGLTKISKHNTLAQNMAAREFVEVAHQINPFNLNGNRALAVGREVGNYAEIQAKIMAIQTGIINGKTMKEAVKDAEDAIFNYSKLTEFERQYLKRLIPFYTFARKNFEFQLKMLSNSPGVVATQMKAVNALNSGFGESMDFNKELGLPSFVADRLALKSGTRTDGKQMYISGFGLPIEEFLGRFSGEKGFMWNTINNIITQCNPILKYPLERITGVDLFKGKPIVEIDNGEAFSGIITALGGHESPVGKEFADWVGYREIKNQPLYQNGVQVGTYTKYVADPIALHRLRSLPISRLVNTVNQTEAETKEDFYLRALLGWRTYEYNEAKIKKFKELQEKKELVNWLERMGVIRSKEIFFEPNKPKQESTPKDSPFGSPFK